MIGMIDLTRIYTLLSNWAKASEKFWYDLPGVAGLGCYGSGFNAWGVQTNQKYCAALAVLAARPQEGSWVDRQWALEKALASLRFSLSSHVSGSRTCTDGSQWGHTWISGLGVERMMNGIYQIEPQLTDQDRENLNRVLTSEADWILLNFKKGQIEGPTAGLWDSSGRNQPESNLWNGSLLWRAATTLPEHPHAADWQERAHLFLLNSVSVPADSTDETILAGKPVRERFLGANFFPNYALDHHGYFNVGYMAIIVSNAAMLHFDMKLKGYAIPETLDRHQADLWQLLRRLVFQNGRLVRIGGDTRVRYAYCQEYLMPAFLYAYEHLNDPTALELLDRQIDMVEEEARQNPDGSFYGKRLEELLPASEFYYTRLESDRASTLAQVCSYLPLLSKSDHMPVETVPATAMASFESSVAGGWCEPEHGAVLHRSPRRLASFAWRAFGLAQGLCQPPDDGHMTDWEGSLAGQIDFVHHPHYLHPSYPQSRRLRNYQILPFDGGFLTFGSLFAGAEIELAEGWRGHDLAIHSIAFAALPDDQTVLALELCQMTPVRGLLRQVKGLHFNLVNDLYNQFSRSLKTSQGMQSLQSPPQTAETISLNSRYACIDDREGLVGIYGADTLTLQRSNIRGAGAYHSLYIEEISLSNRQGPFWANPAEIILDCGWAVLSGAGSERTEQVNASAVTHSTDAPNLRMVSIQGADQRTYLMAANFDQGNQTPVTVQLPEGEWMDVVSRQRTQTIALAAGEARLLYRAVL
jgi:hypothetical protein